MRRKKERGGKKRSLNGASFDTLTPTTELGLRMIRLLAIIKDKKEESITGYGFFVERFAF